MVIFCVLFCTHLFSQENYIGISAGIVKSKFYATFAPFDFATGFDVNIFFEKSLIKHLNIRMGIGYDELGNKQANYQSFNSSSQIQWSDHYLSVPLLLKPHIGSKTKGYLIIGLNTSFLLSDQITTTEPQPNSGPAYSTSIHNSINIGQILGLGVDTQYSDKLSLGLEASSYHSFTNVYKNNSGLTYLAFMLNIVAKYRIN